MPSIYTPTTIWKNFVIDGEPSFISGGKTVIEGTVFESGYIEGRYVDGVRIKIYTRSAQQKEGKLPAVIILNDFKYVEDDNLLTALAEKGYYAVMVDLAGKRDTSDNYTIYPEEIKYANLKYSSYEEKEINDDITKTCYYEWCGVVKYVVEYLKSLPFITKIGAIGINGGATALWHTLATSQDISCSVIVNNTGWRVYEGKNKFLSGAEEGYSDGKLAYTAGVEPQSYAKHVKCPTLILSCTNSNKYDCDRAYDTLTRIDEKIYKAIDYSVNRTVAIEKQTFNNALVFLDKFLQNKRYKLPKLIEISSQKEEKISVIVERENLKALSLFVAEGQSESSKRSWKKYTDVLEQGQAYEFSYKPSIQNGFISYFVKAEYKNGFEICSRVCGKMIETINAPEKKPNNILYTSRELLLDTQFASANQEKIESAIDVLGQAQINVDVGPMKMLGLTGKGGVMTFNVCIDKIKNDTNATLMFDAYLSNSGEIRVKLIADYFGERIEYIALAKIVAQGIWQNIKLEIYNFKTETGLTLKSYEDIEVVEFDAQEDYLINNVLWI